MFTMQSSHCIVQTEAFTEITTLEKPYTAHCTLHITEYTLHTAHYTLLSTEHTPHTTQ